MTTNRKGFKRRDTCRGCGSRSVHSFLDYSVYRTPQILDCFRLAAEYTDWKTAHAFPELMLMQLTAILGKIYFIPDFYGITQLHSMNESIVAPAISEEADCAAQYAGMRFGLAQEMHRRAQNLSLAECESIVESRIGALQHGWKAWKKMRRGNTWQRFKKHTIFPLYHGTGPASGRQHVLYRRLRKGDDQFRDPEFQRLLEFMLKYPDGIPADHDLDDAIAA